jgi:hypothetical protein
MSENVEQTIQTSELNRRSCIRCNQRKVRCDRKYPCSACAKAGEQCSYPGPKRARRILDRLPISELLARLNHREEEVVQLWSTGGSDRHEVNSIDPPEEFKPAKKTELLIFKEGKSRYVGDEASIALGEQVCIYNHI